MRIAAVVLLLLAAAPLRAQETERLQDPEPVIDVRPEDLEHPPEPTPSPSPSPTPPPHPNNEPVSVRVTTGAAVTLTSATTDVTPKGYVNVDGPLALGQESLGRVYTRLGITGIPGETFDPASPETFSAAAFAVGAYYVVGHFATGDQRVVTALAGEWGVASRLAGDVEPLDELAHHWGFGIKVAERTSGASVTILYGRNMAAGPPRNGQLTLYGNVPIPGVKGTIELEGSIVASPGGAQRNTFPRTRDVFQIGAVFNLGRLIERVRDSE